MHPIFPAPNLKAFLLSHIDICSLMCFVGMGYLQWHSHGQWQDYRCILCDLQWRVRRPACPSLLMYHLILLSCWICLGFPLYSLVSNVVHRHEPPIISGAIQIYHRDEKSGIWVVEKKASMPIHSTGRYRNNTLLEVLKNEHNLEVVASE